MGLGGGSQTGDHRISSGPWGTGPGPGRTSRARTVQGSTAPALVCSSTAGRRIRHRCDDQKRRGDQGRDRLPPAEHAFAEFDDPFETQQINDRLGRDQNNAPATSRDLPSPVTGGAGARALELRQAVTTSMVAGPG